MESLPVWRFWYSSDIAWSCCWVEAGVAIVKVELVFKLATEIR